ncbi:MAG: rhodanese-like domain-containing protein [Candidatus Nanopelagicales bacterium]|jgi:rhodanese-related sulfurtransferase
MQIPTTTVADLHNCLTNGGAAIVDVREPYEYASGHIPGAVSIPMATIPIRIQDLPSSDVYVVCESGARSWQVAAFLAQRGISVTNVEGGTGAWRMAGLPLEQGAPAYAH